MFKIIYYKICFLSNGGDLDIGYPPRPLHLAGSYNDSNLRSSSESLVSGGSGDSGPSVVSMAGQVNRRLGHLLGYQDMSSSSHAGLVSGTASITGYEIVCSGDKQKYTVSITDYQIQMWQEVCCISCK